jgi:hypothetical protein
MSHKIAHLSLDIMGVASMCGGTRSCAAWMRNRSKSPSSSTLKEMRERLEQAASIAKAAETCAEAGNVEKGIEIALDIEQLIYEVNTFLNAASLINRISKT